MTNTTEKTDRMQTLMDAAYARWQKNGGWSKEDFWDQLNPAERFAVFIGNMNYQVENGGWSQWIGNGYGTPKVAEYIYNVLISVGTRTTAQVRTILKAVRKNGLKEPHDEGEHKVWYNRLDKLDRRFYAVNTELLADCEAFIERTWPASDIEVAGAVTGRMTSSTPNTEEIDKARNLIAAIKGALGTEEDGDALVEVARNAHRAEQELAARDSRDS